ncbi:MAG TPA: slipin family protein [Spirochaetia bacterium]|nr:slipin family protein [Spirochaetia bacterium]
MGIVVLYVLILLVLVVFFKLIKIVPEQESYVVEQLGKFRKTLGSGFHLVIPFIQRIAYKHILKEEVIDVDPQVCITNDNVQVTVDGILYLKVVDPAKASYGIEDYRFATVQLAKTTMRSEFGKLELDRSFSERDKLNDAIVRAIDQASEPWGIKVTRYEIKDISPTETIAEAMEQQMRAEREKRASILSSEGQRAARINVSKGEREEAINLSQGERQRKINVSEGRAKAIEITANATAQGIREIAEALRQPGGDTAMSLRVAEQYIGQFSKILQMAKTQILPFDIAQIKSLVGSVLPHALSEKLQPTRAGTPAPRHAGPTGGAK